jgi:acyl carrier protein
MSELTTTDTSAEAIRTWLLERVAFYLERPVAEVDPGAAFTELGLDSVYALTLCGDIEDRFGLSVEATLPWDHPTVDRLAAHLRGEVARR